VDNISSYSSRRSVSAYQQRSETSKHTGTSLSRDANSRTSLARTADRISNAPTTLTRSSTISTIYDKPNILARKEDELFESSMTQKFSAFRTSPKSWIPGASSETPRISQKISDWLKKNDVESFSTKSFESDLRKARSIRLKEDYRSYHESRKSGASWESHWNSKHPDNVSQSSRASSSSTHYTEGTMKEMKDFDESYKSGLSRISFKKPPKT